MVHESIEGGTGCYSTGRARTRFEVKETRQLGAIPIFHLRGRGPHQVIQEVVVTLVSQHGLSVVTKFCQMVVALMELRLGSCGHRPDWLQDALAFAPSVLDHPRRHVRPGPATYLSGSRSGAQDQSPQ